MQGDFPWSLYTGPATADNTGSKVYNPQPLLMIANSPTRPVSFRQHNVYTLTSGIKRLLVNIRHIYSKDANRVLVTQARTATLCSSALSKKEKAISW